MQVSNISDRAYLGVLRTVDVMVPLLHGPLVNPHATLITLFMNAVHETIGQGQMAQMAQMPTMARLREYMPLKTKPFGPYDPQMIKLAFARGRVGTFDSVFNM